MMTDKNGIELKVGQQVIQYIKKRKHPFPNDPLYTVKGVICEGKYGLFINVLWSFDWSKKREDAWEKYIPPEKDFMWKHWIKEGNIYEVINNE